MQTVGYEFTSDERAAEFAGLAGDAVSRIYEIAGWSPHTTVVEVADDFSAWYETEKAAGRQWLMSPFRG